LKHRSRAKRCRGAPVCLNVPEAYVPVTPPLYFAGLASLVKDPTTSQRPSRLGATLPLSNADGTASTMGAVYGMLCRGPLEHVLRVLGWILRLWCCGTGCSGTIARFRVCSLVMCGGRFAALRELIPHKDKLDKAAFLQKTVDYIMQLQVQRLPSWLLSCGACGSGCSELAAELHVSNPHHTRLPAPHHFDKANHFIDVCLPACLPSTALSQPHPR
jgi:Helix-loop-helix DNA-binding domain